MKKNAARRPKSAPAAPAPKVRVACAQMQARAVADFAEFAAQAAYFVRTAASYKSDFVVFPEFFTIPLLASLGPLRDGEGVRRMAQFTPQFLELMGGLARRHGLHVLAGSHPVADGGHLYNTSFLFHPDGSHDAQRKLHVTPHERRHWNIRGGDGLRVIKTPRAKIGILICYDAEFPEAARHLADQGAEILFVPYCTDNRAGHLRVRYCAQARAVENELYVVTCGLVGNLPGVPEMDIHYGQSAVFTPSDFNFPRDAILAEADPNIETLLVADLDLAALHHTREAGTVTLGKDRRRDLFGFAGPR